MNEVDENRMFGQLRMVNVSMKCHMPGKGTKVAEAGSFPVVFFLLRIFSVMFRLLASYPLFVHVISAHESASIRACLTQWAKCLEGTAARHEMEYSD